MGIYKKDDWDKPRTQGQHLTKAEIAQLRAAFVAGRRADDIACELQLSTRNANKYFSMFRGVHIPRGRPVTKPKMMAPPPVPKPQKSRFYTSNFEL